jgi:predicted metal-dependent peptidase
MEKTRIYMATEYPWYASMLSQFIFAWRKDIPTAGVRMNEIGNIELSINEKFFYGLEEKARVGLLMRETLHVAMKHLVRWESLTDKQLANVAMNIAINQYIPKEFLPPKALLPEQYQLPRGKAFEFYYVELFKQPRPKQDPLDSHDWDQPGQSDDQAGQGQGLSQEMKDATLDKMLKQAQETANAAGMGNIPQAIEQAMKDTELNKSKVNWKQRLRSYIGRKYSSETENTRNRPNRRMGFISPGIKRLETAKILIGIDESGSMDNKMVEQAISEMKWILDVSKDKTDVIFFDTQVAKEMKLSKVTDIPPRYAGGGTNFQCVIDHATKVRPDLIIILTDGDAPAPKNVKCPILWGIIGNCDAKHLKGTQIKIG